MMNKGNEQLLMTLSRPAAITGKLIVLALLAGLSGCVSNRAPMVASGDRQVHFELLAPHARSVVLLGDFNGWAPPGVALTGPDSAGTWRLVMVIPEPGSRVNYVYLVDDREYRTDDRRPIEADDYGGRNNILYVP